MLDQVRALLRRTRTEANAADPQRIAAMDRQADADKIGDDDQLAKAVAAAECAAYGHVGPIRVESDADAIYTPWGLSSPFKKAPSCQRCGSELPEGGPRDA